MKTKFLISIFLSFMFLMSCSDDTKNSSDKTGMLSVRLTDAPFPYDLVAEANITVFKIEARLLADDDTEEETIEEDVNNEDSPFVILMEDEINVNLLELTNGVTEQIANIEVPVGTYDLVRVYVKGVNVVLTDGRTFDLKVPSGEQTGIKIFIKPSIIVSGGLSSDLLLDFDVSRSFVAKGDINKEGGINGFNFKPVIKASNTSSAGTLVGNISSLVDEISQPIKGAQISIIAADTLNTTTFSDVDGNYKVMGLERGSYKAFAELEGYMSSDTLDVQITATNNTIQDFVLVAEEETEEGN